MKAHLMELLRIYAPDECGSDGYPLAWHGLTLVQHDIGTNVTWHRLPIKDFVREEAGYRCIRCGHPYPPGIAQTCPRGEWTPCDEQCHHGGPFQTYEGHTSGFPQKRWAQWRILTVHHLNGVKWDCRWWNLVALCQRCHLTIQRKVVMEQVYPYEHSEWFKPYAAGWYASAYLGEELTREQTLARMGELLALEHAQ